MSDYYGDYYDEKPKKPTFPMKWHEFLIYFSLWANAVLNVISAISTATGAHYGSNGESRYVYAMFPAMHVLDIVYAVVLVVLAVLAIKTRFSLANFKANGPSLLMMMLVLNVIVAVVYSVAASAILGAPIGEVINIPNIAGGIVYLLINRTYYNKRSVLFVN